MRTLATLVACTLAAGCGGGGPAGPSTPRVTPTPTPLPVSRHPVSGVVFYDENANGMLDAGEDVRLPGVSVTIGDASATSAADGTFVMPDAPAGPRDVGARAASLPPYFQVASGVSVTVPVADGFSLAVPAQLPIGGNRPNVYLAFGDSITDGDGSRGHSGYLGPLSAQLRDYWGGRPALVKDGIQSTKSNQGADRLPGSLSRYHPAYVLIHYGTNDWNDFGCRRAEDCYTMASVRDMIRTARAAGTVPVVSTIIPANPAYVDREGPERNAWVEAMNRQLRDVVREENGVLADSYAGFMAEPNLPSLFSDHVHPNDSGYDVMAQAFYRAITSPRGGS